MKTGQCPKCGSTSVYTNMHQLPFVRTGMYWSNTIPIAGWIYVTPDTYICADCGYVENYVSDIAKLNRIAQKWAHAGSWSELPGAGRRERELLREGSPSEKTCPSCHSKLSGDWRYCPHCGQPMV